MEQKRHLLIDILIALSVLAAIILIDHLIVNFKAKSADEDWPKKNSAQVDTGSIDGFPQLGSGQALTMAILPGQKAFAPILNFHRIDKAPIGSDRVTRSFFIEPDKFEEIVKGIIDNDYEPVFASELVGYLEKKELPSKQILAISFDDGNEDFYTKAWPILQKYKVKSSVYIMTGVGGPNYLTKDQIIELDKSGLVQFGSHTVWHPKLTKISEAEQRRELKDSKDYLENLLGKKIEIICYPFGLYNDQVKQIAKEVGYKAALTFDQDAWQNPDDLLALTRISVYPGLDVMKFLEKLSADK